MFLSPRRITTSLPALALMAGLAHFGFSSIADPAQGLPSGKTIAPARGVFLVAKPRISSGTFHQSVVLLVAHSEGGTLGLIVNRATDIPLAEAVPDLKGVKRETRKLFFGGPVVLNALMFLFRGSKPPEDTTQVVGDLYFSANRQVLERLLGGKMGDDRLRLYLGHSGWAPGQLASEIARGDWELIRADPETVFQDNLDEMWLDLFERAQSTRIVKARPPGIPECCPFFYWGNAPGGPS